MSKSTTLKFLKRELYAQLVALTHRINLLDISEGNRKNLEELKAVLLEAHCYLETIKE